MTVSIIGNAAPELKRALENQNRAPEKIETQKQPGSASMPADLVAAPASPAIEPPVDLSEIIVQVQVQNREAARSTLSDEDFDVVESQPSPQALIQQQAKASLAAQTNKLPPQLMDLLAE